MNTSERQEGYYPTIDPPEIRRTEAGGGLASLVNPNASGDICYTLDGTDPRLRGGAASSSAHCTTTRVDVALKKGQQIKARILLRAEWSAQHASAPP